MQHIEYREHMGHTRRAGQAQNRQAETLKCARLDRVLVNFAKGLPASMKLALQLGWETAQINGLFEDLETGRLSAREIYRAALSRL